MKHPEIYKLRRTVKVRDKTIRRLKSEKQDEVKESTERGKEIEELNKLVKCWLNQLPELFVKGCQKVFDKYIKRNMEK